jgi:hypothetical protein
MLSEQLKDYYMRHVQCSSNAAEQPVMQETSPALAQGLLDVGPQGGEVRLHLLFCCARPSQRALRLLMPALRHYYGRLQCTAC